MEERTGWGLMELMGDFLIFVVIYFIDGIFYAFIYI